MHVFDNPGFDNHEAVHHFFNAETGLRAIIAIHSTALGPAAGGCRRWHYGSDATALYDALRLSRGMTYKNALAGLPFGGGKCVVLCRPGEAGKPETFRALGDAIESLGGRYVTGEDVGVSTADMAQVKVRTDFVAGLPQATGGVGGDPSPWTALGVALCIRTAAQRKLGVDSLDGLTVAIQGVGHVGFHLCRLLSESNVRLIVADVNAANLCLASKSFGAKAVSPDDILFQDADVLAPCALGGVLNARTIPRLKCKVVAGAANNQLETAEDAVRLKERGILFAPDYVINSGGVICIAREYIGGSTRQQFADEIKRIPNRLNAIFDAAERIDRPASAIADEMAEAVFKNGVPPEGPSLVHSAGETRGFRNTG
jgi:leucine dehydrogenase